MSLGRASVLLILAILFFLVYPFVFQLQNTVFAVNDITNGWSSTLDLPNTIASSVATSVNGNLYFFGGANVSDFSQIRIPTIDANGSILSWNNANNTLPQTRYWASLAKKSNRVYILGGASLSVPGNYVDTVYSSTIQSDGTLGAWETFVSLPQTSALGAAAIVGDRIYYAGGFNNNGYSNKIYSAPINPDGSLGSWVIAGDLPAPQIGFSMVEHNGHILIIGGDNSSLVYKTTPDSNGLIISWDATVSLPSPVYRGSVVKAGDVLIEIGGAAGFTTDNVYTTTVHDDGTVDPWILSNNHLPSPVHGGSAVIVGQYLYLMGGYNSTTGSYLSSVYFTKLNVTPPGTTLNVPLLKQTDPLWASQIYDAANLWSPLDPRINSWGCALTSATMILNYHGIVKLPNGTVLTPGTLNTWLKGQVDGYVNNGWVNWLALTRLSKLAKTKNPLFTFDALEYRRVGGYNPLKLVQDLQNNIPAILEEPGHFIVGKGTVGATNFSINDPFYSRLLLSDYLNTFLSIGEFIPSHTDLSYMMFVVDDGITLTVKDSNGNVIGDEFIQAPLDKDGGTGKSGDPKNFYYISVPDDSSYTLDASSASFKRYRLQGYFYNKDGNVKTDVDTGILSKDGKNSYTIVFNKTNQKLSKIRKKITFEKLCSDIDLLLSHKLIHKDFYRKIREQIENAKSFIGKNPPIVKKILLNISNELDKSEDRDIAQEESKMLKEEIDTLEDTN